MPPTADLQSPYLRNAWYVAMWSDDLGAGELRARTILDEPLIFFRREDGTAAALFDRCPHRYAPLSMGELIPGDRIRCGYHGLEFDPDGACVRNPHHNEKIPPGAIVKSYPVVEKHSIVWIWMGSAAPNVEAIPDFGIFDRTAPEHISKRDWLHVKASYRLVADNLLDTSHTPYLHDGILANPDIIEAELSIDEDADSVTVTRRTPDAAVPGLFAVLFPELPERVEKWNAVRWNAPGAILLQTGLVEVGRPHDEGTGYYGVHLLTPETKTTTHYHFTAVRWGIRTEPSADEAIRDRLTEMRRFAFEAQDVVMIEAQQRRIDEAGEYRPTLFAVDVGPVRYGRILDRLIAEEQAAAALSPEVVLATN